jgi:hypothetical protein
VSPLADGRLRRRLTSISSRLHRQERLWSRPCPRQNKQIANPAVAVPVFAMKQIARLDRTEGVHHADAIGEYNLGFHAVGMGNVAVELRPVAVVPSRPVLGINERQSIVGGTTRNRDLPLPLEVVSLLRAKFARRAEKHRAEEKRSGQTPSHGNESITGVPRARPGDGRGAAPDARDSASTNGRGQGRSATDRGMVPTATREGGREKAPRNGGAEVYGDMKKGPTGQGPEPQRLSQVQVWIATLAQVSLFTGLQWTSSG